MAATGEVGRAITAIQHGTKKNIDNVEHSARMIEDATALAQGSGQALREIVSLVASTSDQVHSIATASEEQSAASEEINRSVEEIRRISEQTTVAMRESSQVVEELSSQSQELGHLIMEMQEEKGTEGAPKASRHTEGRPVDAFRPTLGSRAIAAAPHASNPHGSLRLPAHR